MPILQALNDWRAKKDDRANQIEGIIKAFGSSELIPGLSGDAGASLDGINAKVKDLEALLFKTDSKTGELPKDPQRALTRIFEPNQIFGAWFQDATELDLKDKPQAWIQHNLKDYSENLHDVGSVITSLTAAKKEYQTTQTQLDEAKKSGNKRREEALTQRLGELKGQVSELREKLGEVYKLQSGKYSKDLKQYKDHAAQLGKLDKNSQVAFGKELEGAEQDLKKAEQHLSSLDPNQDPVAGLDQMIQDAQSLAKAEGLMVKSLCFTNTANIKAFDAGEYVRTPPMRGQQPRSTWVDNPKWFEEIQKVNAQFGDLSNMNVEGIQKFLEAGQKYLRSTDEQMFKDLPTTLKEGIGAQIEMWNKARTEKYENGEDVTEYDKLINKYKAARNALEAGDTDKALALFKVATDSKRHSSVAEDFKSFERKQFWKGIALEVAIIAVAAVATALTMGALAPEAAAAVAAGTATIGTQVGMALLEGAVFVTFDLALRSSLFAAQERLGLKQYGLSRSRIPSKRSTASTI